MSKVTAPLLSFSAGGAIAKTQVYSSWKGRPYVRQYVKPADPKSTEQTLTRNTFKWLMDAWKYWPTGAVEAWQLYADSLRITDRNAFGKQNIGPLRDQTNIALLVVSPSARSGIIAADMALTGGANQITVALTAPELPSGWTITKAHALAIPMQDPQTEALYDIGYAFDATTPYQPVITGLAAATEYLIGGWFEYLKGPNNSAFGLALTATESTT